MKNVKKLTLGLAVFFCGGSAVLAEPVNYKSSWYLQPSLNMIHPDDRFGVSKDDVGVGLRAGSAMAPNWDVQVGTTYARVRDNGARFQQNILGADALYMFSRNSFRPFVLVGAGAERDKKDVGGGKTTQTSPYINAGVGFQYAFNDMLALQADYRRVHGFLRGNDFGFKRDDNDYLNVGLNISFGPH